MQVIDSFELSAKKSLDSRQNWESLNALKSNTETLMPQGFLAYCKNEDNWYKMNCTDESNPTTYTWSEFGKGSEGNSLQLEVMPLASETYKNKIVQYIGETDDTYTQGYFYKCIMKEDNTYEWINVETQKEQEIKQYHYKEMPVASEDYKDDIVQYIGTTTEDYTQGYFYKCVLDDVSGNYIWTPTDTQKAGEGGGKITEDIKVYGVCDQLGYSDGDIITKGEDYTSILKKLLQRIIHPTYVSPKLTLKADKTYIEANSNNMVVITPTFTKNNAGNVTEYELFRDDVSIYTSNSIGAFTDTFDSSLGEVHYRCEVTYADGEILKNNINEPDTVGQILGDTISATTKVTNVYPMYYGSSVSDFNNANVTKIIQAKGNVAKKFTVYNAKVVFAYPKSYGVLKSIINANNMETLNTYTITTITIDEVEYYCYMGNTTTIDNFSITFKF